MTRGDLGPSARTVAGLSDTGEETVSQQAGDAPSDADRSIERQGVASVPVSVPVVASDESTVEGFESTRWWRVIAPDGSLWCESSDEEENRERMRPGDRLEHLYRQVEYRWVRQ